MQYTRLGKSDLLVSRICMGCMGFGDPSDGSSIAGRWTKQQAATYSLRSLKGHQFLRYRYSLPEWLPVSDTLAGHCGRWRNERIVPQVLPRTPQIAGGSAEKETITSTPTRARRIWGWTTSTSTSRNIWDCQHAHYRRAKCYMPAVTCWQVRSVGIS